MPAGCWYLVSFRSFVTRDRRFYFDRTDSIIYPSEAEVVVPQKSAAAYYPWFLFYLGKLPLVIKKRKIFNVHIENLA